MGRCAEKGTFVHISGETDTVFVTVKQIPPFSTLVHGQTDKPTQANCASQHMLKCAGK